MAQTLARLSGPAVQRQQLRLEKVGVIAGFLIGLVAFKSLIFKAMNLAYDANYLTGGRYTHKKFESDLFDSIAGRAPDSQSSTAGFMKMVFGRK